MEITEPNFLYHLFHLDLMKKTPKQNKQNKNPIKPTKPKIALQALLLQTWAEFQDNPKRLCNESWLSWNGMT